VVEPVVRVKVMVEELTVLENVTFGATVTGAYCPPETGAVDTTAGGAMSLSVKTGST
jgi:hypothetical protein